MLTPEDETLITRAIVLALAKWSVICIAIGIIIGLIVFIATHSD